MIAFVDNCEGITASKGVKKNTEFIRLKQPTPKTIIALSSSVVYPTVSSNTINIDDKKGIKKIDIVNCLGQTISSFNYASISHLSLNINQYANGTYIIKITNTFGKTTLHKFIKN